jgi:hypothetical protein
MAACAEELDEPMEHPRSAAVFGRIRLGDEIDPERTRHGLSVTCLRLFEEAASTGEAPPTYREIRAKFGWSSTGTAAITSRPSFGRGLYGVPPIVGTTG